MPSQNLRVATWVPPGVVPVLGQMIGVSQVSPVLDTEFTTPAFPEAPEDAKLYGRKDAAWALVPPLPFAADAPANTNTYGRLNGAWAIINKATVGLTSADNTSDANKPISIATQAALDTKTEEAPNDGKQYARQSRAWSQVVIPVSLTVDDNVPVGFKVGDRWIRPETGQEAVRVPTVDGLGAWIAPAGAADETLTPILLNNGTVIAPSLAYASEPGLGWYRHSASLIATAAGGKITSYLNAVAPASTGMSICPRTPGSAVLYIESQPNGSANTSTLALSASSTAFEIRESIAGSAVAKPLGMFFPAGINFLFGSRTITMDGQANFATPGNVTAANLVTAGAVNGGSVNASGNATVNGTLTVTSGVVNNSFQVKGTTYLNPAGDYQITVGGGFRTLQFAGNWALQWEEASGALHWRMNGRTTTFGQSGDIIAHQNIYSGAGGGAGAQAAMAGNQFLPLTYGNDGSGGLYSNVVQTGNNGPGSMNMMMQFLHKPGVSAYVNIECGGAPFIHNSSGTATSNGGWTTSDRALKKNITLLETAPSATDAVMAVPVSEWDRIHVDPATGQSLHQIGWVAQDVQPHIPKAVYTQTMPLSSGTDGEPIEYADYLALDTSAMSAVLWKAFQEINARVAALEAA